MTWFAFSLTIFSHLHRMVYNSDVSCADSVPAVPMRPVPTFEISKGVGIIRIVSEIV